MAAVAAADEVKQCLAVCGFATIAQRNSIVAQGPDSLQRVAQFRLMDACDIQSNVAKLPVPAGRFHMGRGVAQNLEALGE